MWRLFLVVILLLAACSPQKYVQRQLQKHPEWAADTLVQVRIDTITTQAYHTDTFFKLNLTDSVDTLRQENDTVRILITRDKDRLEVRTVVKPQKIPFEHKQIYYRQVKVYSGKLRDLQWPQKLLVLGLLLVSFFIGVAVTKIQKR